MDSYKKLPEEDQKTFLKFPVYISLLAANSNGETDEAEENTAIRFDHTKTYTADPLLLNFYAAADQEFESNLKQIDNQLPKGKLQRDVAIKVELRKIKELLKNFSPEYAQAMHQSMSLLKSMCPRRIITYWKTFYSPFPLKD